MPGTVIATATPYEQTGFFKNLLHHYFPLQLTLDDF